MLRVGRMFELLLKMNKTASGLDQSLEEIRIARIGFQPKLLENVVRLVVTLFIPTVEKCLIKWILCHIGLGEIDVFSSQLRHEPRNPLAFTHERLNLLVAQTMSKRPAKKLFQDTAHERSG